MVKGTQHKSCSCYMCKRGRGTAHGQFVRNQNERKLRRMARKATDAVVRGDTEDAVLGHIGSPYTD